MNFPFSSLFDFSLAEWIVGGALFFFFIVQMLFYLLLYRRPYIYEKKRKKNAFSDENLPPISVIISSKNESEELEKNLPFILEQDYPNFEVIVVNSGSTDETDMALKAAEQKYDNLYHTYVPAEAESVNEKKLALTIGIKAAKNDILLFTEAYCKPCSNQWIREFGKEFANGKEIVLGFCKLRIDKMPLRKFVLYDNLVHNLKFLSMAIARKPFMGIGRNLAYRKELFFEKKGFSSILKIDGGEDDLFINSIANGKNTGVVVSSESMAETSVVNRFSVWRTLKSKYLYTKQFQKGFRSYIFGWETFSKYLFYAALACAVAFGITHSNYILLGISVLLFTIRYVTQLVVINGNSRLFDAGKYHINLLFFDLFQPFNNLRFRKYANKRNKIRR